MRNQIPTLYKLAVSIHFLSEIVDEKIGCILSLIGRELQKTTEEIDDQWNESKQFTSSSPELERKD
ncbi:hypothetical protein [Maridesulfovibrio hydrothermalis]|uniref:Uncharacterized protein n=1 Tax=Maridesulfovibrio hydrothermalis AM13 = DSM 14728 TaxID=1121451 RepID=L0R7T1_9BACT|nr:hypothetical protein [Maridesulfovibrio hydrothermalis]CCO22282.1 protein of unknown function [Maridesulfovibrio hydrothermalis AM13 = DSM 14728]